MDQSKDVKSTKGILNALLLAWIIAGTLDISSAIVTFIINNPNASILGLFQFIASGAFGDAAFSGGVPMAIAGLLFHYLIALTWTTIFFLLYPKIKLLSKNKLISGISFGIFVWLVMNLIVLRLSRVPQINLHTGHIVLGMLYLIFFIGIPVSYLANRYYARVMTHEEI